MYSPNNSLSDPNKVTFNILWPVRDIAANEAIYRDFLYGVTESNNRSARLHTWFDTPDKFYTDSLKQLRAIESKYEVEEESNRIQGNNPLRDSLNQ